MITRASLLTAASVLAMACSSGSGGGGTGGAGNTAGAGNMPGGNMGGNNPPALSAGVLGTDPAPDSTDQPPNATDQPASATDQPASATDVAPTATDLPVGPGGVSAPGTAGGGAVDCGSLCRSITQACPTVATPQEVIDSCTEDCHDAMESGCYAEMAVAVACAAQAVCVTGNFEGVDQACNDAFDAVDCNGGGGSVVGPGDNGGGSGCAALQACCNGLAEGAAECNQITSLGNEQACTSTLQIYQASQVCP